MTRSLLILLCVGNVTLCSCSQQGFKWHPSAIRLQTSGAAVDGEWCRNYFIVLATIDGQGPFRLLLDTGAAISLLDDDAATQLGSRVSGSALNMTGGGGASVAAAGQVRIGRLVSGAVTLLDFDMAIHDLARFEPFFGTLDGVLGHSAFNGSTFTIDYPSRTVTVTNEALDPDAPRQENEAWFETGSARPHIVVIVAGRPVRVLVDSGSGGGFDFRMFDELPRSDKDRPSHASLALDRLVVSRAARLNGELRIGPIVFDAPAIGSEPSSSKLGTQVMSKFRWTFDTRTKLIRIDGGPKRIAPHPVTNLGFVGSRKLNAIQVVHVAQDSVTYANGLRQGDQVVAINGVAVEQFSCEGMRRAIERATPVVLTIQRDGEHIPVEAQPYTVVP